MTWMLAGVGIRSPERGSRVVRKRILWRPIKWDLVDLATVGV